jgi:hypothetical protein
MPASSNMYKYINILHELLIDSNFDDNTKSCVIKIYIVARTYICKTFDCDSWMSRKYILYKICNMIDTLDVSFLEPITELKNYDKKDIRDSIWTNTYVTNKDLFKKICTEHDLKIKDLDS